MAKVPGPALLLAGAAALFFLSKKGDKGDAKKGFEPKLNGENEKPDTSKPKAPKAKTQEELQEELEEDDGTGLPTTEEVAAEAQWKVWPPGSADKNANLMHNYLFASEDCESALIGRDWKPIIESDGTLYEPASFWQEFGQGMSPALVVEEVGASQINWYTRRLFSSKNAIIECAGEIPDPADYDDLESFDNAWTALLNGSPALAKLFYEVYNNHVKYPMMAAWADVDPDAYMDHQVEEMAEWAVATFPNEDADEQTDQAYFNWIEGHEDAPQVLDPDNPAHADYVQLWLALNEAIKDL